MAMQLQLSGKQLSLINQWILNVALQSWQLLDTIVAQSGPPIAKLNTFFWIFFFRILCKC